MKGVNKIALVGIAVAAFFAMIGAAAGSVVTAPAGTVYTGTIHTDSVGHIQISNGVGVIRCNHTSHGHVTTHGSGVTAKVGLTETKLFNCTEGSVHTSITPGSYEIHSIGSGNGTIRSSGAKFSITMFGIECGYTTFNTDIGVLTAASSGGHAKIDMNATIPRTYGSAFCGSSGSLSGTSTVTTPTGLSIS